MALFERQHHHAVNRDEYPLVHLPRDSTIDQWSYTPHSEALRGILSAIPEVLALSNATLPDNFNMPEPSPNAKHMPMLGHTLPYGPLHTWDPLPPLLQTNFLLVTIWTTQEWAEILKADDIMDPNQVQKKKDKMNVSISLNMTMRYVQDQHGQVITGFYASDIHKAAYQIWHELILRGIAPSKWS